MSRENLEDDDIRDEVDDKADEDDKEVDDEDEQLGASRPGSVPPFTTTGSSYGTPRSGSFGDPSRASGPTAGRYSSTPNLPGSQRYSGALSGSSLSGGSGSASFGGSNRPSSYSGSGALSSSSASSGSGSAPDAAKSPAKSQSPSTFTSPLSKVTSRLRVPFGGSDKKADKPARPKSPSSSNPLSSIKSRLSGGIGGLLARSRGGQKKLDSSPASYGSKSVPGGQSGSTRAGGSLGYSGVSSSSSSGARLAQPAARSRDSRGSKGNSISARLGALLPFVKRQGARRPATTREKMERAARTPKVEKTGLSLDAQLDIIGVLLLIGALMLFFSSISANKGQITEPILNAFSQLLGWGAGAVPLAMFTAGLWLVVRHFGSQAPVVDLVRLSGVGLLYLSLLLIFQYIDSYRSLYTLSALDDFLALSIADGRGGGWVGAQLYKTLVTNFTEIGGVFILLGAIIIGLMLTLRISASELAVFIISIGRSFNDARRRRAQRRAAAARLAEVERAAALAAQQVQVKVTKPPSPELSEAQLPAALPAASSIVAEAAPSPEPRPIPITMGGRTVTALFGDEAEEVEIKPALTPAPAQPTDKPGRRFGMMGRMRAAVSSRPSAKPARLASPSAAAAPDAAPTPPTPVRPAQSAASSDGGSAAARPLTAGAVIAAGKAGALGRRLFGSGHSPAPVAPNDSKASITPTAAPPLLSAAASPATAAPTSEAQPVRQTSTLPAEAAAATAPLVSTASTPAAVTSTPLAPAASDAAAASVAPAAASGGEQPLTALVRRPPRRSPVTDELLPGPAETPPAAPTSAKAADDSADLAHLPPATPKGIIRSAPAESAGARLAVPPPRPAAETLAERRARLDAVRAGSPSTPFAFNRPAAPSSQPAAREERPMPAATPEGAAAIAAAAAPTSPFRKPAGPPETPVAPLSPAPAQLSAAAGPARPRKTWPLPDYRTLLNSGSESDFDRETLLQRARIIEETLQSFGAPGRVVEVNTGPVITQFGVEPDYIVGRNGKKSRVKVGAIAQLDKDLQLALGAKSIRIEAPVPGKGYVGIEVPNDQASLVSLRDVMDSEEFKRIRAKSPLAIALGQSVDGAPVAADLASMPHLLIAGTTGSGKSVCVNAIIGCLILNNPPDRVKFIMVDPKRVELTGYNGIPHLIAPVVVDLERIVGVLKWVTREMDERYKRFSSAGARNIEDYNNHLSPDQEPMPYIVVIIDELADLMMLAPDETERVITRIAALARATGIHLVIATQRPSVDVVTGLIKANFPARIAFAVAGGVDSRVILDQPGAERLLGRGDMLYMSGNSPAPVRLQGVFLSDAEIANITRYWKMLATEADQPRPITALIGDDSLVETARDVMPRPPLTQRAFWERDHDDEADEDDAGEGLGEDGVDELYEEAVELVRRLNKASVSLLQRRLRIGYTRAARLIDMMEEEGIVGPAQEGAKPREVLPARD